MAARARILAIDDQHYFRSFLVGLLSEEGYEVVAAAPLSPDQEKRYAAALQKKLGRQVRLQTRIDDSLLGGAVLKAGDLVIDGSLKGRLERLATELTA